MSYPAPCVGPGGRTVRSDDRSTILAYLAAKSGFETRIHDAALWVFEQAQKATRQLVHKVSHGVVQRLGTNKRFADGPDRPGDAMLQNGCFGAGGQVGAQLLGGFCQRSLEPGL